MKNMFWSRMMIVSLLLASVLLVLPTFNDNGVKGFSGGGSGTVVDPYQITSADELNETSDDLGANYSLMNDIDLSGCALWNGGEGFLPIGDTSLNPFNGSFNGNNYTISNLFIANLTGTSALGLFDSVDNCVISNLGLTDVLIAGSNSVGGLVGFANNSNISNCYTIGNISAYDNVGGLIGYLYDNMSVYDCYSTCNIVASSEVAGDVGGLIGYAILSTGDAEDGEIIDCSASGDVTGNAGSVGGFIGHLEHNVISSCSASGDITGTTSVGGFIGSVNLCDSIVDCSASGMVTGTGWGDYIGGFIGVSEASNVSSCSASGDVTGDDCIGGLIGMNDNSVIVDCSATGTVSYVTNGGWLIGCCTGCTGGLKVNAFNETSGDNLSFDISVFNSLGVLVYTEEDCVNTHTISFTDMSPVAYNVTIIVSKDGFNSRTYIGVLYPDMYTTLNAYLSVEGNQYLVRVIDEYLYPVDDALVTIKKYISYTGTWETLTTFLTDGYGEGYAQLIGNKDYKVTVSKTSYNTGNFDWHTDPIYFGPGYPKTFKINHNFSGNTSYGFWDIISFTGTMYTNNSIKITYVANLPDTIDASFKTYELYNFTSTLKSTNNTINDTFTFWVFNINSSRMHQITIFLNHTLLGYKVVSITLSPVNNTKINTSFIEDTSTNVFGSFKLGYVNTFILFIPAVVLIVLGGVSFPGVGIIGAGLWIGFASQIFTNMPSGIIAIVPFIIVLGIILLIAKGGRFHL